MSKGRETVAQEDKQSIAKPGAPRSLEIAVAGIKTGMDFAKMMSSLMSDLIEGSITPAVANASCNAGGKLLKVVEMQYKYGVQQKEGGNKVLQLSD